MLPPSFGTSLRVVYPELPSIYFSEFESAYSRLRPDDAPAAEQLQSDDIVAATALIVHGRPLNISWPELRVYAQALTNAPRALRDKFTSISVPSHAQDAALIVYQCYAPFVDGAPPITEITAALVEAAMALPDLVLGRQRTLASMKPDDVGYAEAARSPTWIEVQKKAESLAAINAARTNLFVPLTISKDEQRPNWFMHSLAGADELVIRALVKLFQESGKNGGPWIDVIERSPAGLEDVLSAMLRAAHHFDFNIGRADAGDDSFLTAPSLVAYAGLGSRFLYAIAARRSLDGEEFWDAYCKTGENTVSAKVVLADVIEARQRSGCPLALLLAPYPEVQRIIFGSPGLAPYWLRSLLVLHIFKHCRIFSHPTSGEWIVRVMHGRMTVDIPIPAEGVPQPLNAQVNRGFITTLCSVLQIRFGIAPRAQTAADWTIHSVLGSLTASQLPGFSDIPTDLAIPTQVIPMPITRHEDRTWVNIHMQVSGSKRIDLETGVVSGAPLIGVQALTYLLPFSEHGTGYDPQTANTALDAIPSVIDALLPGEILLNGAFRNIETVFNGIDYREVIIRIIDMMNVANLVRYEVRGSAIGSALTVEFPGLFFGSRVVGEKPSTGQGKTTAARSVGRIWVPTADVIRIRRSSGEVSQRASAMQLMQLGIILADEFKITEKASEDHWCDRDGMQSLMSGGGITVGKVRENQGESRLDYSPIFSGKYFYFPQDIRDRLVPFLLHQFTPDTATDAEIQKLISTNQLAPLLRLQSLLYIQKHHLIERICAGSPGPYDPRFRFPGFRGIYEAMYGEKPCERFFACIAAMRTLATQVCQEARRSGGLSRNRQGEEFQVGFHLDQWDERDLEALEQHCNHNAVSPSEALAMIVLGGISVDAKEARSLYSHYRLNVFTALDVFHAEAESEGGVTSTGGWRVIITMEQHPTRKRLVERVRLVPPPGYQPSAPPPGWVPPPSVGDHPHDSAGGPAGAA